MDAQTFGFALAAGLVAALNPCGFAMLPGYLALVVVGEVEQRHRAAAVGRALGATATMALGFLLVFGTFGLLIPPLAASVQRYLPAVTVVVGVALICLGAWMLTGRQLSLTLPKPRRGAPTAQLGSMFGYGLAYAIASLSCTIGPFLAVTSTTFGARSILGGLLAYLAYGAGMTIVVGVLATATALAGSAVTSRARRLLPHLNRIAGGLLVLVGGYVTYYGSYELRVYSGGDANDTLIEAASGIQRALAGWVDTIGALPLLVVLGALLLSAGLLGRRCVARRVQSPRRRRRLPGRWADPIARSREERTGTMVGRTVINLTTGMEDPERVTVAFLVAVAAAEEGRPTMIFLTLEAVRLALPGVATGVACQGCPPLSDLLDRYCTAGGTLLVCPVCFHSRELDESQLIKSAELGGTVPLWRWIGDAATTTFSY